MDEYIYTYLLDIKRAIDEMEKYNRVRPEFLWGLVIRHIPQLKKDIDELISQVGLTL